MKHEDISGLIDMFNDSDVNVNNKSFRYVKKIMDAVSSNEYYVYDTLSKIDVVGLDLFKMFTDSSMEDEFEVVKDIQIEIRKNALSEEDAESIANDAVQYAFTSTWENYFPDKILSNMALAAQVMMDYISDYILHILGRDFDFTHSETNENDALDMICSMISWDYIYDALEGGSYGF